MPNESEVEKRKKDSAHLRWDTKPRRAPNPKDIEFQTAEIVIPNPHRDQVKLSSFFGGRIDQPEIDKQKMNRLIWGDNLLAMQALLAQGYEGKINLIYIDPPFRSGADYSAKFVIEGKEITKEPSVIERIAYKDTWAGGIDSYLDMLYPRLQLMKRLLAEDGLIFVHIGTSIAHYVKIIMDEIFAGNFRNEIVVRRVKKNVRERELVKSINFGSDTILLYTKNPETTFLPPTIETKRPARWHAFDAAGLRTGMDYELFGRKPPPGGHWRWSKDRAEEAIRAGTLRANPNTGNPEYLIQSSEEDLCDSLWDDVYAYQFKYGFDTEKNETLLERIIRIHPNPNCTIADFFCGSGVTLAVAERLGKPWIGCDFGKVAIQITRNRLVNQDAKPFLIENIGNYQRHMIYLSGGRINEMQSIVLKLYGAMPRKDFPDLGTRKGEDGVIELVYVSYPDRPVTAKKAEELVKMAEKLDGTGYKRLVILGWDYEYNYDRILEMRQRASAKWRTELVSKTIPPEVYEYLRKAKTEEDIEPLREKIYFHEKPYLKLLKPKIESAGEDKANVTIGIERYVIFDIPIEKEEERQRIMEIARNNFAALIDYWAIDWGYDGSTFKSVWQAFRGFGKKVKTVPIQTSRELERGKKYSIAVRLVDVFGNDANGTLEVDLR